MDNRQEVFNRSSRDVKMNRVYRTPKGTELPILSLRGRDYLEVKYRLVWFREEHPDWSIETEALNVTDVSAFVRATIRDEEGRVIATSHKYESKQGFPDFIEKAETGAIGRALALIGYGTQFCADELDEGERIVDAPVDMPTRHVQPQVSTAAAAGAGRRETASRGQEGARTEEAEVSRGNGEEKESQPELRAERPGQERLEAGDYRISFGKKYKGKRLREIPRQEMESYVDWLEASAERKGVALSDEARSLKAAVDRYLRETRQSQPQH